MVERFINFKKTVDLNIPSDILEKCKKEDRKAQFQLYKLCFGVLMSVCLRYKKNKEDATEVLNMGFLKIVKNIEKYNDSVPFEAWIRRIMINVIIDEFRKVRKTLEVIEYTDFQESSHHNAHFDVNDFEKEHDAEDLQRVLRQLPPLSQKVFNLYAIDGYSHKEISDMLGMSVGTSKWHVSTARKELKNLLKEKFKINVKFG